MVNFEKASLIVIGGGITGLSTTITWALNNPIKNLHQPKFSHGIWPCLQAGLQAIDMIMEGNSRYETPAEPDSEGL
jgi:hypothetical protein